jgi:hypothetical protein
VQRLTSALREARAAGDTATIRELEYQGPALQNLMHYQVFSTASIPNVIEALAPVLPQVAERAGVAIIVSKWDVSYRRDDVEYVDVTDELVQPFNPNAQVKKWLADGKTKPPLPLLDAVKTLRPEK